MSPGGEGATGWLVYVVRCADGSLYTGIARDLDRRVREHNEDDRLAARYTRCRRPVILVHAEPCANRAAAAAREHAIKRMAKPAKEAMILCSICAGVPVA